MIAIYRALLSNQEVPDAQLEKQWETHSWQLPLYLQDPANIKNIMDLTLKDPLLRKVLNYLRKKTAVQLQVITILILLADQSLKQVINSNLDTPKDQAL